MRSVFLTRSFLTFAPWFLYRHPTKLGQLLKHWRAYRARFIELSRLSGQPVDRIETFLNEVEAEEPLFRELGGFWNLFPVYRDRLSTPHAIVSYILVRLMQPDVVVETGVEHGLSSRIILLAMERNRRGTLHSIDLPNAVVEDEASGFVQRNIMPPGKETGWMVPPDLRSRWHLLLGDAQELLPRLLQTLGTIDIFLHDSLHSYEHMLFEFRTAWPHLRDGGVLCSDDTDSGILFLDGKPGPSAFTDFVAEVNCPGVIFNNRRVGAIRKPDRQ